MGLGSEYQVLKVCVYQIVSLCVFILRFRRLLNISSLEASFPLIVYEDGKDSLSFFVA